mmetsp:Transcript_90330/g.264272  ORF Transcript_90330/g.264272 Transcript_90330/m.264272 type:complete len:310 (+) Transcript_90330:340-1269(+)
MMPLLSFEKQVDQSWRAPPFTNIACWRRLEVTAVLSEDGALHCLCLDEPPRGVLLVRQLRQDSDCPRVVLRGDTPGARTPPPRGQVDQRGLVRQNGQLHSLRKPCPPRVLRQLAQGALGRLGVGVALRHTGRGPRLVEAVQDLVQKLGHLRHAQAVAHDFHVQRLPKEGQRLSIPTLSAAQVPARPGLHSKQGRPLADRRSEEPVRLRVVHFGFVMLARCQKALPQIAQDLGTKNQLVRLRNMLQPQRLCQDVACLVELVPLVAVVCTVGHQYTKIPQIHPVECFFVVPRCIRHLCEVNGSFIFASHAS